MKKLSLFCSLLLLFFCHPLWANILSPYNVRDYGAVGDGKTLDTEAINQAIEAAAAAGGGTVFFPAGKYLSYSIRLKSNISLFLDHGSTLIAAGEGDKGRYDDPEAGPGNKYQDFGHSHWKNSLIWGIGLDNVAILGTGMIDGKGLSRGFYSTNKHWENIGVDARPYMWDGGANKAIALKLCKNVTLKDFTIVRGGHFGILATGVDNLTIDNLKMDTNRDGMDIDCCRHVTISNCKINTPNDDAICLKSSYALGEARATEDVVITNCQVSGYDLGTFIDGTYQTEEADQVPDQEGPTGRIKMGTESNGGFKNITISNCVFKHCRGLALETVDGALLEDIVINNITMRDVTNSPFFLRLGARMRGPDNAKVGRLRRVNISNVNVYNADSRFSSIISGLPGHPIEEVSLSNIRIWYRPLPEEEEKNIQQEVPEYKEAYPEPQKFGVLPSYGFFIRHVRSIAMHNVRVHVLGEERRTAIYFGDVIGAELRDITLDVPSTGDKVVSENSEHLDIHYSKEAKGREKKNE
ncbi:glycoside hydrolase family 28 protein [Echinicola soli]|uniref:Glycoside hydrolase family 28 protein n=1 Tax=Echinicola soli TaxID=2591634 RepID=A0A514CGK8_9BACT|nr:glycoside hydrolase family 28 protein [Echinicola soli]QDH78953.1 glycoside hydrolase family 28 protein [Echinicola soli]